MKMKRYKNILPKGSKSCMVKLKIPGLAETKPTATTRIEKLKELGYRYNQMYNGYISTSVLFSKGNFVLGIILFICLNPQPKYGVQIATSSYMTTTAIEKRLSKYKKHGEQKVKQDYEAVMSYKEEIK